MTASQAIVDRPARRPGSIPLLRQVAPPGPTLFVAWVEPWARNGGEAKLDVYEREGRRDGVEETGVGLHEIALDVLLDAPPDGSVEPECALLHAWSLPVGGPDSGLPRPRLQLAWGPGQQIRYFIQKLRWPAPLQRSDGVRYRQQVIVELLEDPGGVIALTVAEAVNGGGRIPQGASATAPGERTYTVQQGDTLSSIAAALLEDRDGVPAAQRWPEIAELNGLADPNFITVGQVLRIPAS